MSDWLQDDGQLFDMPSSDMATPIIPLPATLAATDGGSVPELSMSKIIAGEKDSKHWGFMLPDASPRKFLGLIL